MPASPGVGIAVWLAAGEHALVVTAPDRLGQLALGLDLNADAVRLLQPRLRGESALGGPELPHPRGPRSASRTALRP